MDTETQRYIENIDFLIDSLYNSRYTPSRIFWKNKNRDYKYKNFYSTLKVAQGHLKFDLENLRKSELRYWKKYKEEKAKIPKAILEKELQIKKIISSVS